MPSKNRCKCCNQQFSLWVECVIVTFTLCHVLMTTAELLIYLNIIHVPSPKTVDAPQSLHVTDSATVRNVSSALPIIARDTECSYISVHADLQLAITIIDYVTLAMSSLFFIEVCFKAIFLRLHFFTDPWQIFDSVVIVCSLGIQIAFFIKQNTILCYHLATKASAYVIFLRLWRIPRACNVRKKEYARKHENDTKYLRILQRDLEKKYQGLNTLYKSQNEQIHQLEKELNEKWTKEKNTSQIENVLNGQSEAVRVNQLAPNDNKEPIVKIKYIETTNETENEITQKSKHEKNINGDANYSALQRSNSEKNSNTFDSGIEIKDSLGSNINVNNNIHIDKEVLADVMDTNDGTNVIESVLHVATIAERKEVSSSSISVNEEQDEVLSLRREKCLIIYHCHDNETFKGDDALDGTRTYKSAEGIPMTEL